MNVEVNGNRQVVSDGTTLAMLIEQLAGSTRGSAVVVDGEVIPRSQWSSVELRAGQRVELITAVQGG
jgi:sulfur carrier protein